MSLTAGMRLGTYEIRGLLGAGGMGEVYRARDARLGRDVAIKVLPAEVAADASRRSRFEREARTLASLSHPNVLTIFAFEFEGGVPYAVMELVEGETLRARLCREPPSSDEAIAIAATIAAALSAAHARGIVHRDLKPENVLLTAGRGLKVVDFGLAATMVPAAAAEAVTATALTLPGTIVGTPGYMAPEQVRGEPTDHRTDIFALGCITFELLAGKPAFVRKSVADTLSAILRDPAPELPRTVVRHARELQHIIARCLEKDPAHRFQSASDLEFALREHAPAAAFVDPADAAPGADRRPSVAVLPFANLSADAEQEYFCDGMAEEIINALAHVEGLLVLARTSSFAFKGQLEDVRTIGTKLGVGLIVEGSVRRAGDRLRITAQLVEVGGGTHLWSEKYDRRAADVFDVQDEIALAVVENLKVRVLPPEQEAMTRRPPINLHAYDAYLKGLFHWSRLAPDAFAASCQCFEDSIRLDPRFAVAYVFLAQAYASPAFWADAEPGAALHRALPLVEQALALDPQCAEAYTGRGILAAYFEYRWDYARQCFDAGLRLGPGLAFGHLHIAGLAAVQGRKEEAVQACRITLQLDPLSPTTGAWAAVWLGCMGPSEEAFEHLARIEALNPCHWMPFWAQAALLGIKGRWPEARAKAERASELSGRASQSLGVLGMTLYQSGDASAGDAIASELRERSKAGYVDPAYRAYVELARRNLNEGLALLNHAAVSKDPTLPFSRLIVTRALPSDPRIEAVFTSIGL